VSTVLHVAALIVAFLSIPTVAAMTAWSLTGGDGDAKNPLVGFLGLAVGLGAIYNLVICWRSFWFFAEWQWWLMWAPAVAGLVGMLLSWDRTEQQEQEQSWREWALLLGMQAVLAVPALLLLAADVVTL
jgi:hypothetical protein